jgi:hypothetical protein
MTKAMRSEMALAGAGFDGGVDPSNAGVADVSVQFSS